MRLNTYQTVIPKIVFFKNLVPNKENKIDKTFVFVFIFE